MGASGSKGESVPNETENPVFLLDDIHVTFVPALTPKNWLFFALSNPGFTFAALPDLVMFTLRSSVADPQVLAALHIVSGFGSLHTYLLAAWAALPPSTKMVAATKTL
jgi:hypothetical protein